MSAIASLSSNVTRSFAARHSFLGACGLGSRSSVSFSPRASSVQPFTKAISGHVRHLGGIQRQPVTNGTFSYLHRLKVVSGNGLKPSIGRSFHTTRRDLRQFRIPKISSFSKELSAHSLAFHRSQSTSKKFVIVGTVVLVGFSLGYSFAWFQSARHPAKSSGVVSHNSEEALAELSTSSNFDHGDIPLRIGKDVDSSVEPRQELQLLNGVELEFLLLEDLRPACLRMLHPVLFQALYFALTLVAHFLPLEASFGRILDDSETGFRLVYEALLEPIVVRCCDPSCAEEHGHSLSVKLRGNSTDYNQWEFKGDRSIKLTDLSWRLFVRLGYLRVYAIEIATPKLPYDKPIATTTSKRDPNHVHHVTADELRRAACEHLDTAFNSSHRTEQFRRYRLTSNPSCGTHFHIGLASGQPSLPTVKKFLTMWAANERVIDRVTDSHRISGGPFEAYNHSLAEAFLGPSTSTAYWQDASWQPAVALDDSFPRWADIIRKKPTFAQLSREFYRYGRNHTVNIGNLEDPEDAYHFRKPTLEIRQPAGTLDPEEINHHNHFLNALFQYSHNTSEDAVLETSLRNWSDPNHTFLKLLDELQCPEETKKFFKRKLTSPSAGPVESWNAGLVQRHIQIAKASRRDFLQIFVAQSNAARANSSNPIVIKKTSNSKLKEGGYGRMPVRTLRTLGLKGPELWKSAIYEEPGEPEADPARLRPYVPYHTRAHSRSSPTTSESVGNPTESG